MSVLKRAAMPARGFRHAGYTPAYVEVGVELGAARSPTPIRVVAATREAADDAVLVDALAEHDAAALDELYARHSRSVYSLALHLLGERGAAEEVVQETFLKLWRRPFAYQPTRGRLLPWLLGVAHHHAIDLLRRRRLELRFHASSSTAEPDGSRALLEGPVESDTRVDPQLQAEADEARHAIARALAELPASQRVPLELAYFRGMTQVEIATHLSEPLGTVKTRMRLALQRLRLSPGLSQMWESR